MCQAPSPPCENPRRMMRLSSMLKRFFTAAMDSKTSISPAQCQPAPLMRPKQSSWICPWSATALPGPGVEEAVDELGFGGVVLASVQPDVETSRFAGIVVFRQRHAVGENRAVNFRVVGMDLLLALIPLRLIGLELFAALDALIERAEGMVDGGLRCRTCPGYSRSIRPACA